MYRVILAFLKKSVKGYFLYLQESMILIGFKYVNWWSNILILSFQVVSFVLVLKPIFIISALVLRIIVLGEKAEDGSHDEEGSLSSFYRIERNLRHALKPMYEVLFERLNTHPGGLKFLSIIRAEILSILA